MHILNQTQKKHYTILLCIITVLTGCTFMSGMFKYAVPLEQVSIEADKDANDSSATEVDLIVVNEPSLTTQFGAMTAKAYFAKKDELQRANTGKMKVWHWELVPGKKKSDIAINFEEFQPEAAFVFAKYNNDSENRIMLKPAKAITILLKRSFFQIHSIEEE